MKIYIIAGNVEMLITEQKPSVMMKGLSGQAQKMVIVSSSVMVVDI